MTTGWIGCAYGLKFGVSVQKSQFLNVCHDECSLKRARPRLSEQTQDEHLNARSSELDLAQAKFPRSGTWILAQAS